MCLRLRARAYTRDRRHAPSAVAAAGMQSVADTLRHGCVGPLFALSARLCLGTYPRKARKNDPFPDKIFSAAIFLKIGAA